MTTVWWQGPVVCAVCGHRHRMAIEIDADADGPPDGTECPRCGSMSCVVADDEQEQP